MLKTEILCILYEHGAMFWNAQKHSSRRNNVNYRRVLNEIRIVPVAASAVVYIKKKNKKKNHNEITRVRDVIIFKCTSLKSRNGDGAFRFK